jgi:hypothetical protein
VWADGDKYPGCLNMTRYMKSILEINVTIVAADDHRLLQC